MKFQCLGYLLWVLTCGSGSSVFPDLHRHPYSNSWPHAPNTIRVEGLADLSGPFATEGTQTALGAMLWRDWINDELGGLCLDPQRDTAEDGYIAANRNCRAGHRYNVSLVLWDVMRGGTLPDRLKYYRQWSRDICTRPIHERPHVVLSPFTSAAATMAIEGLYNVNATASIPLGSAAAWGCGPLVTTLASARTLFSRNFRAIYTSLPTPEDTIAGTALALRGRARRIAVLIKDGDLLSTSFANGVQAMRAAGVLSLPGEPADAVRFVGRRCRAHATDPDAPACETDADCAAPDAVCTFARFRQSAISFVQYNTVLKWVQVMKATGADTFIVGGHIENTLSFMEALRHLEWSPAIALSTIPMSPSPDIDAVASEFWLTTSLQLGNFGFGVAQRYMGTSDAVCTRVRTTGVARYYRSRDFVAGQERFDDCQWPGMAIDGLLLAQRAMELASSSSHQWTPHWPVATSTDAEGTNQTASILRRALDSMGPWQTFWGDHALAPVATTPGALSGTNNGKRAAVFQFRACPTITVTKCAHILVDARRGTVGQDMTATNMVFPADWEWERKWQRYEWPASVWNTIVATASIVTVFFILCGTVLINSRNHPVARASAFLMTLLQMTASTAAAWSTLLLLAAPTNAICNARLVVIPSLLWLSFAPALAKTYRIKRIFQATGLRAVKLTDRDLINAVALVMVVQISVLAFCVVFDPSSPRLVRFTTDDSFVEVLECTTQWVANAFSIVSFLIVMLVSTLLAWNVRHVPSKFNESLHIAASITFVLVFGMFILVLNFILDSARAPESVVLLRSIGIMMAVLIGVGCLVVPRCWIILLRIDTSADNPTTYSGAMMSTTNPTRLSGTGTKMGFVAPPPTAASSFLLSIAKERPKPGTDSLQLPLATTDSGRVQTHVSQSPKRWSSSSPIHANYTVQSQRSSPPPPIVQQQRTSPPDSIEHPGSVHDSPELTSTEC